MANIVIIQGHPDSVLVASNKAQNDSKTPEPQGSETSGQNKGQNNDQNKGDIHFCHAIATAYENGAKAAGHQVSLITPAQLDFPWLSSQQQWQSGKDALPAMLSPAVDAMTAAHHIVIIYPLWLGTMPAILKAFLEQCCRPGIALEDKSEGFPKGLFVNKSARIIVTMGMPAFAYKWFFFAHGLKNLQRNILKFIGVNPIRTTLFGQIDKTSEQKRKQWLKHIYQLAEQAK